MGARLARYTNNETYAKWSSDTWDWLVELEYIDKDYNVYDGAHVPENCKDIDKQQYSYNPAVLLLGAAHMYNFVSPSDFYGCRHAPNIICYRLDFADNVIITIRRRTRSGRNELTSW